MTSGAANNHLSSVEEPLLAIEDFAVGGRGVGRSDDGRVTFVEGGVPGDFVRVEVLAKKKRFVEAVVSEVIEASPHRVDPWCAHRRSGCGGCDWQHVAVGSRHELQLGIVEQVLARAVPTSASPPVVVHGGSVPEMGYRTSARLGVGGGRVGFRMPRSNEVVAFDHCGVLHEGLSWVCDLDWGDADEVMVRHSTATGESLAVVTPSADAIDLSAAPSSVRVVGRDELSSGRRSWLYEEAAGCRFRLSAEAFFQSGPAAVELLVNTIVGRVREELANARAIVDLYAGVGVFCSVLSRWAPDAKWVVVESNRSAVADARTNLAEIEAKIVASKVERYRPDRADVVIADPPRAGLGKRGVAVVDGCRPSIVVLVSCDLGSFGRDSALLVGAGYHLRSVDVLDLFPQTSQAEVVSVFGGR